MQDWPTLFSLYSTEENLFRAETRKFLEREVLPHVDGWEREKHYPSSLFEMLGAQGYLGILLDEKWNGIGGNFALAAAWCEEFGRMPSVGMTTGVNMHSLVVLPAIQRYGTVEAKERLLKDGVAGKRIGAYAFTEPGAGSDLTRVTTKAVRDGDRFILNGSKTFITNGARADFVIVLAKTDAAKGYNGFTSLIVDTKSSGFQVTRVLEKLGWHASDTAELSFTDVEVPESMVLGAVGQGWAQAMSSLQWERLMLSLGALGAVDACLESTVRYVNERRVFDRPVGAYEATQERLASLWSVLTSGRALCYDCVGMLNRGERCRKEVSLAKLLVSELAVTFANSCLQLHGGYGYTTEFKPERWLRDLRLNPIGGGTSEIMARIAAREYFPALG